KDHHGLFGQGLRLAVDCVHKAWEADRAWAASKDTTRIAVLEEFVRLHGDSRYAALARARMDELRNSQAASQTTVPPDFDAVPRPVAFEMAVEPRKIELRPRAPVWARPSFLGIFNVRAGAGVEIPAQPAPSATPAPAAAPAPAAPPAAAPPQPQAHSGWIIQ